MYSENDYREANLALKKFDVLYIGFAVVMLGAIAAAMIIRTQWLAYAAAAILTISSLFLWGNYGIRLVAWSRFLKDLEKGLEHEIAGVIATIDEEDSLKEGLEFRAVHLLTGDDTDKIGGRLLYVDASRLPLPVSQGQKVNCKVFGNYLKEIQILEDN
jgi:hypothetical protein